MAKLSKKVLDEWIKLDHWYDPGSAKEAEVIRKLTIHNLHLTEELISWNKRLVVCTGLMAVATFILALVTWIKL